MAFKTNSAREIFYIFLWLVGLIFLYTLVHTYFLEPSSGHSTPAYVKSETKPVTSPQTVVSTDIVKPVAATPKQKRQQAPKGADEKSVAQPVKVPTVVQVPQVQVAEKTALLAPAEEVTETSTKEVSQTVSQTPILVTPTPPKEPKKEDTTNKVSEVTTVATIPNVPEVPTVSTPVSVASLPVVQTVTQSTVKSVLKEVTQSQEKSKPEEEKTENAEATPSSDRDATMKLLETARQHIIEKAEATRRAVMQEIER